MIAAPSARTGTSILGTNAKSLHTARRHGAKSPAGDTPRDETKTARFKLLRSVQSVLYVKGAGHQEQHRSCWCHRATRGENVNLWRAEGGERARYTGLNTCGSVWACPICAPVIAAERQREISEGMARWIKGHGGHVLLMTLTHPHEADLPLLEQLDKRAKAELRFKNSRTYKRLKEQHGRLGSVRSLECTWGLEHGWHPHTHELLFVRDDLVHGYSVEELQDPRTYRGILAHLRDEWIRCCIKAGLATPAKAEEMTRAAFQIQGGDKAAEYVAKFGRDERWGLSNELTATHAKIGRAGKLFGETHFTPLQLIAWADREQDAGARALLRAKFREYADAFTGKRALTWTPKLKAALEVDDQTDEEIIEAHESTPLPDEKMVASLSVDQFSVVLKHNYLGELLAYVREYCTDRERAQADVDELVAWLNAQTPTHAGALVKKNTFGPGKSLIHA